MAAPELGGVVLGAGLSLELGLPLLLVRKAAKEYGTTKRIEGRFEPGEKIAIVEDIVTSGGAAIQAAEALREAGLVVDDLYCVVDREEGGAGRGRRGGTDAAAAVHVVGAWVSPSSREIGGLHSRYSGKYRLCMAWAFGKVGTYPADKGR